MSAAWVCCPSTGTGQHHSGAASSATRMARTILEDPRGQDGPRRRRRGAAACGRARAQGGDRLHGGRMVPLGCIYPSPWLSDRGRASVRGARSDPRARCRLDEDEFVRGRAPAHRRGRAAGLSRTSCATPRPLSRSTARSSRACTECRRREKTPSGMEGPMDKKTILVVEDEKSDRGYSGVQFAARGVRPRSSPTTARRACAARSRTRTDLVLLDVMLPRMDGFCGARAHPQGARHADHHADRAARRRPTRCSGWSGARMITSPKPFSMRELMARVKANMRRTLSGEERARPAAHAGEGLRISRDNGMVLQERPAARAVRARV